MIRKYLNRFLGCQSVSPKNNRRSEARRMKFGVESLETRLVPAGVTATLSNGVLEIVGTEKPDTIEVRQQNNKIEIDGVKIKIGNKMESSVSAANVNQIKINGLGGDDVISLAPKSKKDQPITINHQIFGGAGNDKITGGKGMSDLYGGAGNDTIQAAADNVFASLVGDAGNDTLVGGPTENYFSGGEGNDTIIGNASARDSVSASSDASLILTDTTLTGQGSDTLKSIESAYLNGGASGNTFDATFFSGDVTMWGNGGNDTLRGGRGVNRLYGGDGVDFLVGQGRDDYLDGGNDNDTIRAAGGNDTVIGGAGNDVLFGEAGNDILFGNEGADTLIGGTGKDHLFGGQGNDVLAGGDFNGSVYSLDSDLDVFYYQPGDKTNGVDALRSDAVLAFNKGTKDWSEFEIQSIVFAMYELQKQSPELFTLPDGKSFAAKYGIWSFERTEKLPGSAHVRMSGGKIDWADSAFSDPNLPLRDAIRKLLAANRAGINSAF